MELSPLLVVVRLVDVNKMRQSLCECYYSKICNSSNTPEAPYCKHDRIRSPPSQFNNSTIITDYISTVKVTMRSIPNAQSHIKYITN
jgi:hypothetical protein